MSGVTVLTTLIVLLLAAIGGAFAYHYFRVTRQARQQIEKAFRNARPRLYRKSNSGITVLVRADDRDKAYEQYEDDVRSGKKRAWENILILVQPAFIFCEDDCAKKLMRTGREQELNGVVGDVIIRSTGVLPEDFRLAGWSWTAKHDWRFWGLEKLIVPEDPFLFVPFSSNAIPIEKQAELFQKKTIAEAYKYLVHQQ